MAWTLLLAAGAAEIVMAIALKHTDGWTRLGPSMIGVGAALASIFLLSTQFHKYEHVSVASSMRSVLKQQDRRLKFESLFTTAFCHGLQRSGIR